ncbi:MAG TPA: RcnB family protein [Acidobacteriaceae bacterium]
MNRIGKLIAFSTLSAVFSSGMLIAQDDHRDDHHDSDHHDSDHHDSDHHDNHAYVRHNEWKKGYHMRDQDWRRGEVVDYRTYHLRKPPRGYEWREVDGNYVMAAVATGIIASAIIAAAH